MDSLGRRDFLRTTLTMAAMTAVPTVSTPARGEEAQSAQSERKKYPWPLVLNASTIRPAPVIDKVKAAAAAGWDGLELWTRDLEAWEGEGKKLTDLRKIIEDHGLFVPNVIGLWDCMPDGEAAFEASLTKTRERLRQVAEVGSQHVAVLPFPDRENFDLNYATQCYRRLIHIARDEYGIVAAMEYVGFLKGIYSLGQAACVALNTDEPSACLIMDTFHLFRGGSGFSGVRLLSGNFIADFHWNDLPEMPREQAGDKDRIYPGDGVFPLRGVLKDLLAIGYRGPLSLELFREELWAKDPYEVAREGLEKMRACVESALA
jgi:sugar phosphate isomerase/epimerase